jgi:hypothetical protein
MRRKMATRKMKTTAKRIDTTRHMHWAHDGEEANKDCSFVVEKILGHRFEKVRIYSTAQHHNDPDPCSALANRM